MDEGSREDVGEEKLGGGEEREGGKEWMGRGWDVKTNE